MSHIKIQQHENNTQGTTALADEEINNRSFEKQQTSGNIFKALYKIVLFLFPLAIYVLLVYLISSSETSKFTSANKYLKVQLIQKVDDLPFCVLITNQKNRVAIQQSINQTKYTNFNLINFSEQNYTKVKQTIQKRCPKNSVIMFVNQNVQQNTFRKLNQVYQKYTTYATISINQSVISVNSFYYRIFQLLSQNDFNKSHQQNLNKLDQTFVALSVFQLCKYHLTNVGPSYSKFAYFSFDEKQQQKDHKKYQPIFKLSQDQPTNQQIGIKYNRTAFEQNNDPNEKLNRQKMVLSLYFQDLIYLPQNHALNQIEHKVFNQRYKVDLYKQKSEQTPFCVTITSFNNNNNFRYKKVMESVVQQKYQNYHIVFVDDVSSDNTMNETRKVLKQLKFPIERVTFIQNIQRNYVTYNVFNSIYNYCKQDDVFIQFDGDDELIGKYVFQVINSQYRQNPNNWVVYTSYKNIDNTFGISTWFKGENTIHKDGKRIHTDTVSHIRTWRVKMLYKMPLSSQLDPNGKWLDMDADKALTYPALELSGVQRVQFIPEVFYLYNSNTGNNDHSTQEKAKYQYNLYFNHILKLKILDKLQGLDSKRDPDIERITKQDLNKRYKIYDSYE